MPRARHAPTHLGRRGKPGPAAYRSKALTSIPSGVREVKSAVETLSPTRVKLLVEVPFDELKPELDKAYQTIASSIQIPGFRKGKVPSRIIDQRVGRGAVVQEAVNEALPRFFAEAAEAENSRRSVAREVEVTAVPLADGEDFEFTVETDVRPEIELPSSRASPSRSTTSPSDDDVEERLTDLRQRFGTLVGVDRAVETGDRLDRPAARIGDTDIDPSRAFPTRSAPATCLRAWTTRSSA